MERWFWDKQRRFSDFVRTLHSLSPVLSKKRFSDFAQNFFRSSLDDINLFVFENFVTSIFPIGKKSDLV